MTWGCFVKGIMKENEESSLTALNSICACLDFFKSKSYYRSKKK